jgi:hypothetical protein
MATVKKPIKKAQTGKRVPVKSVSTLTPAGTTVEMKPIARELTSSDKTRLTSVPKTKRENVRAVQLGSYNSYVKDPSKGFQKPGLSFDEWMNAESERGMKNARNNPEPKSERTFWAKDNGPKSPCKGGACSKRAGGTVKKAKSGATVSKAKDGMWMQKAAASIKKRGTAGKCTPITKPGCTGRAKALAKTFKKIAKSNKKK